MLLFLAFGFVFPYLTLQLRTLGLTLNDASLIAGIAPTKLILWEHPILDSGTDFTKSLAAAGCCGRLA